MQIRMLRDVTAAANPAGTKRRLYARGQTLSAEAEWQSWMFKAFLAENWAEVVADTSVAGATKAIERAPENKTTNSTSRGRNNLFTGRRRAKRPFGRRRVAPGA